MKKIILLYAFIAFTSVSSFSQIQFVHRVEQPVKQNEENYIVMPYKTGLIAFRTQADRGSFSNKKFQYFITDQQLLSEEPAAFELPEHYEMAGYDIEGDMLYLLLKKNNYNKDQMIFEIALEGEAVNDYKINSVLAAELQEFFIINQKAVLMGTMENRPVIQIYDFSLDNVITLQGIYANDAKIIQMRKDHELDVFDVVMSKRDFYKNKIISILTFDIDGNKLREVKIDQLDDPKMEIVEGVLTAPSQYRQAMVGPYGLRRKESFQGFYMSTINEFGEYNNVYFSLEDLPNFYNYLPDRARKRKVRSLEKSIQKDKKLTIPNVLATREAIALGDYLLVYNDYLSPSSSRYSNRDGMYNSGYYHNSPLQRRMPPMYYGMWPGVGPMPANTNYRQFRYLAAQFLLLDNKGNIIWDNSLSLQNSVLPHESKFGEVSFDGSDLYYMYLDKTELQLSHIKDGEVIFENESFPIELIDANERIKDTDESSLSLMWWYDNYFLLSGKQRVRYQTGSGKEENKEVFFITKIKVD
ncbi:hypothetical protein [Anditalea andensis]|uniref:Transcriptional regulator n=1 Tax=Anditalea andensis TaxID=1048983 RepID=A0A074L3N3_9BACT|nr:hypothetical protein [Anditalea andensis]KEO74463.1 hypothetical protein EL17_06920 [Anditalea andensis]